MSLNFECLKGYVRMLHQIRDGESTKAWSTIGQMKDSVESLDRLYSSGVVKKFVYGELDKIDKAQGKALASE